MTGWTFGEKAHKEFLRGHRTPVAQLSDREIIAACHAANPYADETFNLTLASRLAKVAPALAANLKAIAEAERNG